MYFVYILQSYISEKFYIGQTQNLIKKPEQHNSGYSKSTKNGALWKIVFKEEFIAEQIR